MKFSVSYKYIIVGTWNTISRTVYVIIIIIFIFITNYNKMDLHFLWDFSIPTNINKKFHGMGNKKKKKGGARWG